MTTALVVTSIAPPNDILRALAHGAAEHDWPFYLIGDSKSPPDFSLPGARYFSIADQIATGFAFAAACPTGCYARKNIGYLAAMRDRVSCIVESDDDNRPYSNFWTPRQFLPSVAVSRDHGWVNVFQYSTADPVWPRGFPLDAIRQAPPAFASLPQSKIFCPIQQGLVDGDPDVDAIYRLLSPPAQFRDARRVAIARGSWCPFNSQNTAWSREAFPLLYLPAYSNFRMTDTWRSFIAQRIAHENDWAILFHESTLVQERNQHDLLRDFESEIPGYLHNRRICELLAGLALQAGPAALADDLRICYESLIAAGFLDARELSLLDCWLADLP
ncbi:MAG TPA: STELLO glycosyltransferase family protein [Bryobacteraceae bacterium]|nr:STELLO glycosyltransferase family protein [Bryobacteraceae bacterium]